ncbi:Aldo/keto reductase [Metschnikowia bicuspidata var. bicuspidata NRRL YB-4993]|uniref:2-dehydropantolactone reductase n=1 Tax=Metschnikowia bicuspidata var. bicuspidata NRRL YB-4993 TaxID=869754 RepID=A0A1A0HDQ1_9ASCO|nr:Aldo/keto reductase [Metschnikowia bicuspidata var. bicuspidata NRRL YB-4993]OBA22105.1 Aldo/keto reductase [Metschnikowia bicuspidata var. bicuspidata NRRL YB-4993]
MSLQGSRFQLADGHKIPAVAYGLGTAWFKYGRNDEDQRLVQTLQLALEKGFVHIDGAEIYNTDAELGAAIAGADRAKLYITNKFLVGDAGHSVFSPHGLPYDSLKHQLATQMKTGYVDLYLLHSPFVAKAAHGFDLAEAWRSMEKIVDEGLARSIGVSNFRVEDLQEILKIARIRPVVNQIEYNALLQNQTPGIVEFSQQNGILVEAYSPLGPITKGPAGELSDYLQQLADTHHKTPAQVLLRWVLQRGILPVTTSSKEDRIVQFLDLFDFELSESEAQHITVLGKKGPVLRQYWLAEFGKYDQ